MIQILVVEDDMELNKIMCKSLEKGGYQAYGCTTVSKAFDRMEEVIFDMIITDIMMPVIDGFELAESVRMQDKKIPILFVTARNDFTAKQKGFLLGIDDYMVKPVDMKELLLRVGALIRRANIATTKRIEIGTLVLDSEEICAYLNGEELFLTVKEFNILYKLLSYPKKTFTRNQLMEVSGIDTEGGLRTIDVYITKLRNKFNACIEFEIVTVHGLGYKAVINEKR